jgi:cytochrome c oxidase subunit 2
MAEAGDAVQIKISANQWWWKVEYGDPIAGRRIVTANELHLPVGRPARISLEAATSFTPSGFPTLAASRT